MESSKEAVQGQINQTPVIVYSKDYCPFCVEAKNVLKSKGVQFEVVELNKINNGDKI